MRTQGIIVLPKAADTHHSIEGYVLEARFKTSHLPRRRDTNDCSRNRWSFTGFLGARNHGRGSYVLIYSNTLDGSGPISRAGSMDPKLEPKGRNCVVAGRMVPNRTRHIRMGTRRWRVVRASNSQGRSDLRVVTPPPFAADVAMNELRKARIKRQSSSHIFVCPRLCSSLWVKQLYRACDIVFQILPNSEIWPSEMHEPLLIGIAFPFLRVRPWQLRGCPKMLAVGRELRELPSNKEVDRRDLLFKFWSKCHGLRNMPENVVWQMLHFGRDAKVPCRGRSG
jgi:hypothetical protein